MCQFERRPIEVCLSACWKQVDCVASSGIAACIFLKNCSAKHLHTNTAQLIDNESIKTTTQPLLVQPTQGYFSSPSKSICFEEEKNAQKKCNGEGGEGMAAVTQ